MVEELCYTALDTISLENDIVTETLLVISSCSNMYETFLAFISNLKLELDHLYGSKNFEKCMRTHLHAPLQQTNVEEENKGFEVRVRLEPSPF